MQSKPKDTGLVAVVVLRGWRQQPPENTNFLGLAHWRNDEAISIIRKCTPHHNWSLACFTCPVSCGTGVENQPSAHRHKLSSGFRERLDLDTGLSLCHCFIEEREVVEVHHSESLLTVRSSVCLVQLESRRISLPGTLQLRPPTLKRGFNDPLQAEPEKVNSTPNGSMK